jgi:uncharacterized protein (TIGR03086 family)
MASRVDGMTTSPTAQLPMPQSPDTADPRPLYRAAQQWARTLIAGVRAGQLDQPTGCPEFDVRALLGHLVATVRRARVIGAGGNPFDVPLVVTGVADADWADAYAASAAEVWAVWDDDTLLGTPVTAPWGTVPGVVVLWGYLNETLVHGHDLALATGQPAEADPAVAAPALARAPQLIPAEVRGGHMPFGPVVEPAADAGPTERLANWSGRTTRRG